jgi:cell shape-determining protein MreC
MNDFFYQLLLLMIVVFLPLLFFVIVRLILFIKDKFSDLISQIQCLINDFNEFKNLSKTKK